MINGIIPSMSRFLHPRLSIARPIGGSRMTITLVDDAWPSASVLRRLSGDADPLAALRGIMLGALLSILAFWMPLAISLTR